jgi:hypothetical protein
MTARVHLFFFSAGKAAIGGGYIRRGVTHKDLRQLGSVSIPKRTSKTVDFTIPAGTAGRLRVSGADFASAKPLVPGGAESPSGKSHRSPPAVACRRI